MGDVVHRARALARALHAGQTRKHGTPYVEHPEAVATILADEYPADVDDTTLVVALLHDLVEDTAATVRDIAANFGPDVADDVDALTKRGDEYFAAYAARLGAATPRARLVKAADRLHNLREAPLAGDPAWAARYAAQTRDHVLPLVDDPWFRTRISAAADALVDRRAE